MKSQQDLTLLPMLRIDKSAGECMCFVVDSNFKSLVLNYTITSNRF